MNRATSGECPPWATGDTPDTRAYMESELFVAGALSTMPPFDKYHPAWALPFARQALDAIGRWEPSDASHERSGEREDDCGDHPLPDLPDECYAPLSVVLDCEPAAGGEA